MEQVTGELKSAAEAWVDLGYGICSRRARSDFVLRPARPLHRAQGGT